MEKEEKLLHEDHILDCEFEAIRLRIQAMDVKLGMLERNVEVKTSVLLTLFGVDNFKEKIFLQFYQTKTKLFRWEFIKAWIITDILTILSISQSRNKIGMAEHTNIEWQSPAQLHYTNLERKRLPLRANLIYIRIRLIFYHIHLHTEFKEFFFSCFSFIKHRRNKFLCSNINTKRSRN